MEIKAIIVDLDRTLLHTDKTISPYTVDVLKKCQDKGIKVLVATARPIRAIQEYLQMIKFDAHGSIIKASKDGVVRGTMSIAKYDGNWYWKSEVIDESREEDGTWPEYVQPLPETLDRKVKEVE